MPADQGAPVSPAPAVPGHPPRVLGALDATSIVVGAIIGVGIFLTPGRVVQLTGATGPALLAWAVGGAIALCGALVFAELGARYTADGAQYQVLRDAFGPLPAFLFVFSNATAIQAGAIGVIAVVCANNILVVAGAPPNPGAPSDLPLIVAIALIAGITLANVAGVKWGARIQNLTVFCKVLTLLAVTALAVFWAPDAVPAPGPATAREGRALVSGILGALVPAFFAYGGWQHALWITGEIREPRRNLPRAVIGGVLLVVAVYLFANWAYLHLLGVDGVIQSKAVAADAVGAAFPEDSARARLGRRIIGAAVAISAFGVLNAQLLSGPRLVYGMAADGRFFAPFARIGRRSGTPGAAIILLGFTGAALLIAAGGANGLDWLVTWAVFIDQIFFALTGLSLIVLRRRRGAADDGLFRAPGYPVVPLFFVAGALGIMTGALLQSDVRSAALIGAAWIGAGALLYAVFFRRR